MSPSEQTNVPARETPIRAIIRQNQERGVDTPVRPDLPWTLLGILTFAAITAAIAAWCINERFNHPLPVRERAFRRMARGLGLERHSRELVKQLAAECGLEPLTLLVSPSAMHSALASVDRDRWRERRGWSRVIALGEAA